MGTSFQIDLSEILYDATIFAFMFGLLLLQFAFIFGIGYVIYYLFSLPRRRLERAMVFLNVVDAGMRRGATPEDTIKKAAACGDDSLSIRFHLAAGWILKGATWREAVTKVPRLLPPNIAQMLLMSDRIGGWQKVYPVCKRQLIDVLSQLRARQSCLSPSIVILPIPIFMVATTVTRVVLPKFHAIAQDYEIQFTSLLDWITAAPFPVMGAVVLLGLIPLLILFIHIAGPRLWGWRFLTGTAGDRIDWLVPWQRKRLQRDFALLLGLLLDAGVPEAEAVELAAKGTANVIMASKAIGVRQSLTQGKSLPDALAALDTNGEFQWRFQQAAEGGTRFENALSGWCDALQARADQMQQTAMHIGSVTLLLLNALLVGLITHDVFGILIRITEEATQ